MEYGEILITEQFDLFYHNLMIHSIEYTDDRMYI